MLSHLGPALFELTNRVCNPCKKCWQSCKPDKKLFISRIYQATQWNTHDSYRPAGADKPRLPEGGRSTPRLQSHSDSAPAPRRLCFAAAACANSERVSAAGSRSFSNADKHNREPRVPHGAKEKLRVAPRSSREAPAAQRTVLTRNRAAEPNAQQLAQLLSGVRVCGEGQRHAPARRRRGRAGPSPRQSGII
jgi:hypothetical protein